VQKYKSYIVMRERLLTDTPILRTKLHQAVPEVPALGEAQPGAGRAARFSLICQLVHRLEWNHPARDAVPATESLRLCFSHVGTWVVGRADALWPSSRHWGPFCRLFFPPTARFMRSSVSAMEPMTSNGPLASTRGSAASRFSVAQDYRRQRASSATPPAILAASSASSAASSSAAAADGLSNRRSGGAPGPSHAGRAFAGTAAPVVAPPRAPPRVKRAIQAAMEYRQKKAEATAAAAQAAAATAGLPPRRSPADVGLGLMVSVWPPNKPNVEAVCLL
jgi:hypothetical protein